MLQVGEAQRREMIEHAERGYPHEVCGLLLGRPGAARRVESVRAARNRNTERAVDRYDLHPDDFLQADLSARERGLEIVGIYHSHPDHPARPSETDRQAAWPGWSYVIVSVHAGVAGELRSFELCGEAFEEEPLEPA